MLHLIVRLIPAPLHRLVLNVVHRVRVVWWRMGRREPDDCRVLAIDDAGRVLLVRHSYGSGDWMLPGGGAKRGEDAIATATRELREETGCGIDAPRQCGAPPQPGVRKRRFVVVGRARGTVRIDEREIIEAGFHTIDALPARVSPWLGGKLAQWIAQYEAGHPGYSKDS